MNHWKMKRDEGRENVCLQVTDTSEDKEEESDGRRWHPTAPPDS